VRPPAALGTLMINALPMPEPLHGMRRGSLVIIRLTDVASMVWVRTCGHHRPMDCSRPRKATINCVSGHVVCGSDWRKSV
jgi:hypothetical protein